MAAELRGPVRRDHLIMAWHPGISYTAFPRMYADWDIARSGMEAWLDRPGLVRLWDTGIFRGQFPCLRLIIDSQASSVFLVERPVITRPPDPGHADTVDLVMYQAA